ncbi:hypothetical protein GC088_04340 [Arthrobacter sp. JZ12]|uniref:Trm112 family protein n=1 Tax=Arthrobacter sp. JZ12 TaxID=2654190 RepID=UPI002B46CBC7|nr:hypothetical protein [Arthrobacter sp. JZ12]WRH24393.1 hypothetical protein GC088_04340 [Arthrobacter sp. JZ12]
MPNLAPDLLAVLRCPVTGSALVQDGNVLRSAAPGADGIPIEYPIEESIPVLLPPELRAAANPSAAPTSPAPSSEEPTGK